MTNDLGCRHCSSFSQTGVCLSDAQVQTFMLEAESIIRERENRFRGQQKHSPNQAQSHVRHLPAKDSPKDAVKYSPGIMSP